MDWSIAAALGLAVVGCGAKADPQTDTSTAADTDTSGGSEAAAAGSDGDDGGYDECAGAEMAGDYHAVVRPTAEAGYTVLISSRGDGCVFDMGQAGWEVELVFPEGAPSPGVHESTGPQPVHIRGGYAMAGEVAELDATGTGVEVCSIDADGTFHGAISLQLTTVIDLLNVYGTFAATVCN